MHVEVLEDFGELGALGLAEETDEDLVRSASGLAAFVALFVKLGVCSKVVCVGYAHCTACRGLGTGRLEACRHLGGEMGGLLESR